MNTKSLTGWKDVILGEVAEFINGRAFKPEEWEKQGKIIIRIQDLTNSSDSPNFTTKIFEEKYHVKKGDLLISWSATLDAFIWNKEDGWLNQHIFKVKEKKDIVDRKFLFYLIRHRIQDFKEQTHGSTMKHITKDRFTAMRLLLPPLNIQQKIVSILEKAEKAKELRKESDELTKDLLKVYLLEIFENYKNSKWPIIKLKELSSRITKGESPRWQGFEYQEEGILFITSENVGWGNMILQNMKYIPTKFHQKLKRSQIQDCDLLINLVGASIGRATLVPKNLLPSNVNQAVAVITLDKTKINPIFALHVILSDFVQRKIRSDIVEVARANISLTNIRDLDIPLPPISLQNEFVSVISEIKKTMEQQQKSKEYIDNLFNNLIQKSFKGELVC